MSFWASRAGKNHIIDGPACTYKHLIKHHSTPPSQHYFLASYLPTKPISTAEAVRVTMVVTTFTFGSKVGIGLSVGVTGGGTMHY